MATKKLQILNNIITTDTTLSQSGIAADAKMVGDSLANKIDADDVITSTEIDEICGTVIISGEEAKL